MPKESELFSQSRAPWLAHCLPCPFCIRQVTCTGRLHLPPLPRPSPLPRCAQGCKVHLPSQSLGSISATSGPVLAHSSPPESHLPASHQSAHAQADLLCGRCRCSSRTREFPPLLLGLLATGAAPSLPDLLAWLPSPACGPSWCICTKRGGCCWPCDWRRGLSSVGTWRSHPAGLFHHGGAAPAKTSAAGRFCLLAWQAAALALGSLRCGSAWPGGGGDVQLDPLLPQAQSGRPACAPQPASFHTPLLGVSRPASASYAAHVHRPDPVAGIFATSSLLEVLLLLPGLREGEGALVDSPGLSTWQAFPCPLLLGACRVPAQCALHGGLGLLH